MLAILAESALRSLLLGGIVWVGLNLLRVRNPHVQMTSWLMVLMASLSMPLLMHWATITVTLDPLPVPSPENLWPAGIALPEPLPSEEELKARLEKIDRQLNKAYDERLKKTEKEGVPNLRDSEREWIKRRDEGVKIYVSLFPDAEKERRRLQFLGDVTAARIEAPPEEWEL